MPFLAHRLINNDPVPNNCNHRDKGTTNVEIDGGRVAICDGCDTVVVVTEYPEVVTAQDQPSGHDGEADA